MYRTSYIKRLLIGSVVAVGVTVALTVLVMWMNGLIVEDKPSQIAYTPCVFGEKASAAPKNPYAKDPLVLNCIPPEDAKPLITQWFDSILSRRSPEERRTGPSDG